MKLRLWSRNALILLTLIISVIILLSGTLLLQFRSSISEMVKTDVEIITVDLVDQLKRRGELLTNYISEDLVNPVYRYDMETLYEHLKTVKKQKDVAYAYIYDAEGKIIHDGTKELLLFDKVFDDEVSKKAVAAGSLLIQVTDDVVDVNTPIRLSGDILGGIRIGFSLDGINEDIQTMKDSMMEISDHGLQKSFYAILIITAGFFMLAVLVSLIVARRLSRPIEMLSALTTRIGRGEYDVEIPIQRSDEIGELAASFMKMTSDLQETTVSRDQLIKEIAEHELTGKALKRAKTEWDQSFDALQDHVCILDMSGAILRANKVMREKHGPIHGDLTGLDYRLVYCGTASPNPQPPCAAVLSGSGTVEVETELPTMEGFYSVSSCPCFDEDGNQWGAVSVVSNITDRKKAEDKLQKAKEAAEIANRAKSDFLSHMSHELRTPLGAILGFAQYLESGPEDALDNLQKESVQEILLAGWHLHDLINELLDLSAIEAGRLSLTIEPLHIREIIDESLRIISPLAKKQGVTIEDKTQKCFDQVVQGDDTRLKQVLLNLLSNAVKYNEEGGTITLNCNKTEDGMLRISVADTGTGIPDDQQEKLFQPFERFEAEKKGIEGTGIGLTITKTLIEHMGGSIGFKSTPEKGSTFWIDLVITEIAPATPIEAGDIETERDLKEEREKYLLLYVEDNISNIKLVNIFLSRRSDIKLYTAQTAELGLELAQSYKPDVILLDIQLPQMDGYEMLKCLQTHVDTKDIPVIALTAHALQRDIERGLEAGFLRYLTKPINFKELMEAIGSAIK